MRSRYSFSKFGPISKYIGFSIQLKICPNFNGQYLERIKRYPHSVKSNDSYKGGRFDCQKIKEI